MANDSEGLNPRLHFRRQCKGTGTSNAVWGEVASNGTSASPMTFRFLGNPPYFILCNNGLVPRAPCPLFGVFFRKRKLRTPSNPSFPDENVCGQGFLNRRPRPLTWWTQSGNFIRNQKRPAIPTVASAPTPFHLIKEGSFYPTTIHLFLSVHPFFTDESIRIFTT